MIKIFDAAQIKQIDNSSIKNLQISSVDLMEKAALAIYERLKRRLSQNSPVFIFAGPGNNGGDALAVARMLSIDNYRLYVYLVAPERKLSVDCAVNKERLEHLLALHIIEDEKDLPDIQSGSIIIDGLFGSGLNRPAEGLFYKTIERINNSHSTVYSIDMPSGLFVKDNTFNNMEAVVKAKEVFSFQFPKLSLLLPESGSYCGKMILVDIGLCEKSIAEQETAYNFIEKKDVSQLLSDRGTFAHKGDFGKAMLIAGSKGKIGAAVLAAKACLRSGVGLLTMHVPYCGINILQSAVPEAMVDADVSDDIVTDINVDIKKYTIGIGPGIGTHEYTKRLLYSLFDKYRAPLVLDADAINIIAESDSLKTMIPSKSILTPHVVEFDRLVGVKYINGYQRLEAARHFASEYDVYIVLKGAYSAIITPENNVYFNSTGNPGMASGGSGDVLTGIITSLLAQKYTPLNAAVLGVYLHGYAGDFAAKSKSRQGMLASDIIDYIGNVYKALKQQ